MIKHMVVAVCAAFIALAPASAANLVVNGSFETGDFSGWEQVNDTSFTGVVEGAFGGELPTDGEFQAFFGPVDPGGGGILQDIATTAGGSYDLTFSLANLGNPPNAFGLFWDGAFVSIDFDQDPFAYTTFTTTLTASSSTTSLGFIFYHEPSYYLLDGISLESTVPEPATWGLMIVGFGMVGVAARRRKAAVTA